MPGSTDRISSCANIARRHMSKGQKAMAGGDDVPGTGEDETQKVRSGRDQKGFPARASDDSSAAAASPARRPSRGQSPIRSAPVIGFLNPGSLDTTRELVAAVHRGLSSTGYVEGRNLAVEYRWAEYRSDRLTVLADDLVRRKVAVIFAVAFAAGPQWPYWPTPILATSSFSRRGVSHRAATTSCRQSRCAIS
jgi:hypothetical protein